MGDDTSQPPATESSASDVATAPSAPLDEAQVEEVLTRGEMEIEGRLVLASNVSFRCFCTYEGVTLTCIYKPVAGERPLWDFPAGTLAARERAARVVSAAGGWDVVPPTVIRDGRFGTGMVQHWIEVDPEEALVDVIAEEDYQPGWLAVLEAEDETGEPVFLVHADDDRLRSMAVLDVVINNADRKGGHVLLDEAGHVWGCDHGVTFHQEDKLRTVLWGWAGEALQVEDLTTLRRFDEALEGVAGTELAELIRRSEVRSLRARVTQLLECREMPSPGGSWRTIPWPAM